MEESLEKVILIGVCLKSESNNFAEDSLDELSELVKTAGALVAGRMIQNLEGVLAATYIGKGKTEELKNLIAMTEATGIVCDDELTSAQMKHLEEMLDTKIMDRTMVILDIFAKHATTKEGKIQVELAQLKYRAAHLVGMGQILSRLGGGIGTRGPGESKLEMDKRLIRNRISQLKKELLEIQKHRMIQRKQRDQGKIPVIAIVGYTNAGKSTLLNYLTGSDVYEQDQLFATLDPTTRNARLQNGQKVLYTDTVGFIRKLPHHLIEAFHSTLEEAKYADIILHVVDASNPRAESQMQTVYETLSALEIKEKPIITVYNKQDKAVQNMHKDEKSEKSVFISAKTGQGVELLLQEIGEMIQKETRYIDEILPFEKAGKISYLRNYGQVEEEEYLPEGIHVVAYLSKKIPWDEKSKDE